MHLEGQLLLHFIWDLSTSGFSYPQGVLEPILYGYQRTPKFLGHQQLYEDFDCVGVIAPNPNIVQESVMVPIHL